LLGICLGIAPSCKQERSITFSNEPPCKSLRLAQGTSNGGNKTTETRHYYAKHKPKPKTTDNNQKKLAQLYSSIPLLKQPSTPAARPDQRRSTWTCFKKSIDRRRDMLLQWHLHTNASAIGVVLSERHVRVRPSCTVIRHVRVHPPPRLQAQTCAQTAPWPCL
jgi:hypothetical protein